ncbi:ATPase WRNIP1, partial [Tanacetum coccineum]
YARVRCLPVYLIAVHIALQAATKAVKDSVGQNQGVPLHLRNAPAELMKELGFAKGYIYTPDNPFDVQSFLPPSLYTLFSSFFLRNGKG